MACSHIVPTYVYSFDNYTFIPNTQEVASFLKENRAKRGDIVYFNCFASSQASYRNKNYGCYIFDGKKLESLDYTIDSGVIPKSYDILEFNKDHWIGVLPANSVYVRYEASTLLYEQLYWSKKVIEDYCWIVTFQDYGKTFTIFILDVTCKKLVLEEVFNEVKKGLFYNEDNTRIVDDILDSLNVNYDRYGKVELYLFM